MLKILLFISQINSLMHIKKCIKLNFFAVHNELQSQEKRLTEF
jgi:hypothetical protein